VVSVPCPVVTVVVVVVLVPSVLLYQTLSSSDFISRCIGMRHLLNPLISVSVPPVPSAEEGVWFDDFWDDLVLTGETNEGSEWGEMERLCAIVERLPRWYLAVRDTRGAQAMQMPKIISMEL
jgi:hypothetical protein